MFSLRTSAASAGAEANYFVLPSRTKLAVVEKQPAEVITRGTDRVQASGKAVRRFCNGLHCSNQAPCSTTPNRRFRAKTPKPLLNKLSERVPNSCFRPSRPANFRYSPKILEDGTNVLVHTSRDEGLQFSCLQTSPPSSSVSAKESS